MIESISVFQIINGVLNLAAVIWLVRVETSLTRINTILQYKLNERKNYNASDS
jgi:uncharacterized membrane protein